MTQATATPTRAHTTPLMAVGDAEIIRRVRLAHRNWQTKLPTQSLVTQIAIDYARQTGQDPTCGTHRARRLRSLVQTADLDGDQIPVKQPDRQSAQLTTPMSAPDNPPELPDIKDQTTEPPEPTPPLQDSAPKPTVHTWPVLLLSLSAFVAIWSGWVGLGKLTGFGPVHLLPGTPWADWRIDSAITLPLGMEAYAAFALYVWLSGRAPDNARRFARRSAIMSLVIGMAGQIAYHLMIAAGWTQAPWPITTVVACLPVAVLGLGAGLAHLIRADRGV